MKQLLFLLFGAFIGAGGRQISSTNSTVSVTNPSSSLIYKLKSIDQPDQDSSISFADAQIMRNNYMADSRKFKFRYHDPQNPSIIKEDYMQGLLFNSKSIQDMINSSGCSKVFVAFGVQFRKVQNQQDTLLTTILLPATGSQGNYTFITKTQSGAPQDGIEFSTPCPPYCVH